MKVTIIHRPAGREEEVEIAGGGTILDALRKAGISPDVTVCMMGGRPVPVDTPLREGQRFDAVTVVSGG